MPLIPFVGYNNSYSIFHNIILLHSLNKKRQTIGNHLFSTVEPKRAIAIEKTASSLLYLKALSL